jgi:hypothetical protein
MAETKERKGLKLKPIFINNVRISGGRGAEIAKIMLTLLMDSPLNLLILLLL